MTLEIFNQLHAQGFNRIPVEREVLVDTETPLSIYLKLGRGRHSYFFESISGGEKWGRYSIIGLPCKTVLRVVGNNITVEEDGAVVEAVTMDDPFDFIEEYKSRYKVAERQGRDRFSGGLVGYFSYDSMRYVEKSVGPSTAEDELETPEILLMVSEEYVAFDNLTGTIHFVINVDPEIPQAYEKAQLRLDELETRLGDKLLLPPLTPGKGVHESDFVSQFSQAGYEAAVNKIKDYIVAGDVMQVVLAQRMSVPFEGDPMNVYRALRYLNPSPYMVYFDMGDHHVVSASPEILARVEDGNITVRPLAGTRRRGATDKEDKELEQELLADTKELAEHLMLIDLSRNDAGRVSQIGSVEVVKKMFVERYSHVMHIASIVEGKIRDDKSALDVLKSTLPVGTLSGAPKVRAMQIIDELETVKRGIYGGAMGYIAWNNNLDMAIAIRTAVIKNNTLYVQAGAGVVADSDPTAEWEETLNKAKAIIRAVQLSDKGLSLK
ncbi:MAG: anthranilate synthase component I [SAR86 cluster bacterium]|uniref:Anthranilate synthase component 1 n=1 Tax=SAR86 cluster bacterium TaxID=2030880 RepID=A0A2A4MQK8_9GAMM|nr:MAG: anthranilate synthase component I [SAR86 cluster bacterium]